MNIKIELENIKGLVSAFETAPSQIKANLQIAMNIALRDLQSRARAEHRFRTRSGNLERSIKAETISDNPLIGRVFLNSNLTKTNDGRSYGEILHNGVNHSWIIKPVDKRCLRWSAGSEFIYAKSAVHKPIQPDEFLYQAAEKEQNNINNIFKRYVNKSLREAGINV